MVNPKEKGKEKTILGLPATACEAPVVLEAFCAVTDGA